MDPIPPRRLLLVMGSLIAFLNLVIWTANDFLATGEWTARGLMMALFILTAVLLMYVALRLALRILGRDAV